MARRGRPKISEYKKILANRSYRNIFYGAITVIVLFVVGIIGLNLIQKSGNIGEPGIDTEGGLRTYTVKEGDTLWSISQKTYNDPYKWPDIAKANKIKNPDLIEKGIKLVLPGIQEEPTARAATATPAKAATPTAKPTARPTAKPVAPTLEPSVQKITGNIYTVVPGDNLWNIAIRAYGDGYKWVEIARANKLANPDLIHRGNKFVIPR